jgi:hypothetical protein
MSTALRLKPLSWESAGSAAVDTALALAFAAALADCFADVGSFAARWRRADVCSVRAREVDIAASRSSSSRRIGESAKLPAWILPRAVQCDRGPGTHAWW